MRYRELGRTGLKVSELALGGLFVSSYGGEPATTHKAVSKALELGINYIDTAPSYLDSEKVLGEALSGTDTRNIIISTKLGGKPDPFNPKDKDALRFSLDESLRLLRRNYIDILMVHEPDRPRQHDWWSDTSSYIGPVTEVLHELKKEGLIRFIGLGGTTVHELALIMDTGQFDVVLTAFNYSLLWREAEHEVFPTAKKHNMGIIIGSPFQQGALSKRYDDEVNNGTSWLSKPRQEQYKALYHLIDECQIPIHEMGIRFVLSNPLISCVLSGARSSQEIETNAESADKGPLPLDILKRLDEINAMVPFRPCEEPFSPPFGRNYKGPGSAGR